MAETDANEFVENRGMSPDDFHDRIPRIIEVAGESLQVPDDLTERLAEATRHLLVAPGLLREIAAALVTGNVVLQGPPGTGKSSLARAVAAAFNVELYPVTAHEDWSTFEVIGRQELRVDEQGTERIVPVNGHFTEAVIRCGGNIPRQQDDPTKAQATWLLIDELNRAHPDKSFGELFSVLGTDDLVDITLSYQPAGNDRLVVPRRFRIIATVNSVDKQFVNSLSQGLRRRFTFLTVDIPEQKPNSESWADGASMGAREFSLARTEAVFRTARSSGVESDTVTEFLATAEVEVAVVALFELLQKVRYAGPESPFPFIPIGTAPVIDTLHLFLTRCVHDHLEVSAAGSALDWATSVKLVPLFEAGAVDSARLAQLADGLQTPFSAATRRAMLEVASDGMYYVPR